MFINALRLLNAILFGLVWYFNSNVKTKLEDMQLQLNQMNVGYELFIDFGSKNYYFAT